uniref:Uncharacterized protein n=1 Tax=Romanomermis culicivorax TaxID=13658 RepID=A0A915L0P3_ROMCU
MATDGTIIINIVEAATMLVGCMVIVSIEVATEAPKQSEMSKQAGGQFGNISVKDGCFQKFIIERLGITGPSLQ